MIFGKRVKVVGAFTVADPSLMLVVARLHHKAGTEGSRKRYLNMQLLIELEL